MRSAAFILSARYIPVRPTNYLFQFASNLVHLARLLKCSLLERFLQQVLGIYSRETAVYMDFLDYSVFSDYLPTAIYTACITTVISLYKITEAISNSAHRAG